MREIRFRGKTEEGEWAYGYYVKQVDCCGAVHFIYHSADDPDDSDARYFVQKETIGQFTGLTDNNGKRIFEGDIVEGLMLHSIPILAMVSFQDGAFGLDWRRGNASVFTAFTSFCNTIFSVIGNIHDNPELLKGE